MRIRRLAAASVIFAAAVICFGAAHTAAAGRNGLKGELSGFSSRFTREKELKDGASERAENNGGYFVKVGDRVYFRDYGKDGSSRSALFGKFILGGDAVFDSEDTAMMYYDEKTGKTVKAFADNGTGPIWYGNGRFYLTRWVDDASQEAYAADPDGKNEKLLGKGSVEGLSEDGSYVVTKRYDMDSSLVSADVYKDGEMVGTVRTESDSFSWIGEQGDRFFLEGTDAETGAQTIWSVRFDDPEHPICLGDGPQGFGDDMFGFTLPERLVGDGKDIWISFGNYQGSGHFYSGGAIMKADPEKEGSIETVRELSPDDSDGKNGYVMPSFDVKDGEVILMEGDPGTAEYGLGDLMVYGDDGNADVLFPGYIPQDDNSAVTEDAEIAELVGGSIYLYVNRTCYDDLGTIGWRPSYTRLCTYIRRLDIKTREEKELLVSPAGTILDGYVKLITEPDGKDCISFLGYDYYGEEEFDRELVTAFHPILLRFSEDFRGFFPDGLFGIRGDYGDMVSWIEEEGFHEKPAKAVETELYGVIPDYSEESMGCMMLVELNEFGEVISLTPDLAG